PAIGLAFGLDRAVILLKDRLEDIKNENKLSVFFAAIGKAQKAKGFVIVDELRRVGIKCEMDFSREELKPQLKQANKLQVKYTIIFGQEEAEKDIVLIKNMESGTQVEVGLGNIEKYFTDV
ncbi:MAG: histidyl-tRNA synthetase, partial [Candidatus Marinamargulisbacteria bacterium]